MFCTNYNVYPLQKVGPPEHWRQAYQIFMLLTWCFRTSMVLNMYLLCNYNVIMHLLHP